MQHLFRPLGFALAALQMLLGGCAEPESCLRSQGPAGSQTRLVDAHFRRVVAGNRIDLELVTDCTRVGQVELIGPRNLLDFVATERQDSTLSLRVDTSCDWLRNLKFRYKIRVYVATLSRLEARGTARIATPDTLRASHDFTLEHQSTEDIRLNVRMPGICVWNVGSVGGLELAGQVAVSVLVVWNVGGVRAADMQGDYTFVYHYGTAEVRVRALKGLEIRNFHSGTVYWRNQPTEFLRLDNRGTGRIVEAA